MPFLLFFLVRSIPPKGYRENHSVSYFVVREMHGRVFPFHAKQAEN